jgi:ribosomal protein S18 acetylase RimI-like enzyme
MHAFDCAQVLLRDGEPVGLIKLQRIPGEWQLVQLQLVAGVQGQGLGRDVLEEVLADAAAAGADVCLDVLKTNPARHLYERLGFLVVGEDEHEYLMKHHGRTA